MQSNCSATSRLCEPWGNELEESHWKGSALPKSFRFTKRFTKRCWRKRRCRYQVLSMRQNRQPQPDQRSTPCATVDHHLGSVSVKHLETLGDIRHADPP